MSHQEEAGGAAESGTEQASLPFDAAAMVRLLHSMGIKEFEPRVVYQLLEVYHRHTKNVLSHARKFAAYANQSEISPDDARLAIEAASTQAFKTGFSLHSLRQHDAARNRHPVPRIPHPEEGLRLPPREFLLTEANPAPHVTAPVAPTSLEAPIASPSAPKRARTSRNSSRLAPPAKPASRSGRGHRIAQVRFNPAAPPVPASDAALQVETKTFG